MSSKFWRKPTTSEKMACHEEFLYYISFSVCFHGAPFILKYALVGFYMWRNARNGNG